VRTWYLVFPDSAWLRFSPNVYTASTETKRVAIRSAIVLCVAPKPDFLLKPYIIMSPNADISSAIDNLVAPVLPPRDYIYTGYGRDLVPFFSDDSSQFESESRFLQPLEARRGSPKAVQKPKRRQTERTARPRSGQMSPNNKMRSFAMAETSSDGGYHAPGYQSSPKPEALPLPTSSLIERAVGGRATFMGSDFVNRVVKVAAA
jgi:hypothetical protein